MEASISVTVRSRVEGGPDDYGNATVTTRERSELVYGWAPAGTSEVDQRNTQVTHDLDLMVPSSMMLTPSDEVLILGEWFRMEGRLRTFDHGPFQFKPGAVARLKRVTG